MVYLADLPWSGHILVETKEFSHVRNSHTSTLEGAGPGPPPPFFPTAHMIIGRCGDAMRGADTWPVSEGGLDPINRMEFLV